MGFERSAIETGHQETIKAIDPLTELAVSNELPDKKPQSTSPIKVELKPTSTAVIINELLPLPPEVDLNDLKENNGILTEAQKIEIKEAFAQKSDQANIIIYEDKSADGNINNRIILRSGDIQYLIYKPLGKGGQCAGVYLALNLLDHSWHAIKHFQIDPGVLKEKITKGFKKKYSVDTEVFMSSKNQETIERNVQALAKVKENAYKNEATILNRVGQAHAKVLHGQGIMLNGSIEKDKESAALKIENVYIPMNYAAGMNLKDYINYRIFSPVQLIALAKKMCEAVLAFHKLGILHRDIKLSNFVYDAITNKLALVDYELAAQTELKKNTEQDEKSEYTLEHNNSKPIVGTAAYMAPELRRQNNYNEATELYAVGVSLGLLCNFGKINEKTGKFILFKLDFIKKSQPEWSESLLEKTYALVAKLLHETPEQRLKTSNVSGQKLKIADTVATLASLESESIQLLSKVRNVAIIPVAEIENHKNDKHYLDLLRTFDTVWLQDDSTENAAGKPTINTNKVMRELQQKSISVAGALRVPFAPGKTNAELGKIPSALEERDPQKNINSYYYLSEKEISSEVKSLKAKGLNYLKINLANTRENYIKEILNAPITIMQYEKIIAGLEAEIQRLNDKYPQCSLEVFTNPELFTMNEIEGEKDEKGEKVKKFKKGEKMETASFREQAVAYRIVAIRRTMESISAEHKTTSLTQATLRKQLNTLEKSMHHTNCFRAFISFFFGVDEKTDGKKKIKALEEAVIDKTISIKLTHSAG